MPTTTFYGTGGTNCNGVSYGASTSYTISNDSSSKPNNGRVYYKIASINDGKPIRITGIQVSHDASQSADNFNLYFTSNDKLTNQRFSTSRSTHTFRAATVEWFNGLLENNRWPANKQVTEHTKDYSPTSGSCHIIPNAQRLLITWEPLGLAHVVPDGATTYSDAQAYIHDGTNWIEAIPYIHDGTNWVEAQ